MSPTIGEQLIARREAKEAELKGLIEAQVVDLNRNIDAPVEFRVVYSHQTMPDNPRELWAEVICRTPGDGGGPRDQIAHYPATQALLILQFAAISHMIAQSWRKK